MAALAERETRECSFCSRPAFRTRAGERFLCTGCARYWDPADLESGSPDSSPTGDR